MFDIPKDRKLALSLRNKYVIIATTAVFILLAVIEKTSTKSTSVPEHSLSVASYSPMDVSISGYGKLIPRTQRGINAISGGHIVEIYKRPGDLVTNGEKIFQLENPKLVRSMETSELELLEQKSTLQRVLAESIQTQQEQEGSVSLAEARLNYAQAELLASETLYKQHVISELELHKSQIAWQKEQAILQMEVSRLATLKKTRKAIDDAAKYRLLKAEKQYDLWASQVQELVVRANMEGMLTEFSHNFEVGQFIEEGQVIGMVADLSKYYAQVTVTANDSEFIALGLQAQVSIKGIDVIGVVSRIEPTVTNGSVDIDISFNSPLPASVKPDIDVTATVKIASHDEALVIRKPVGINRGHREHTMYILDKEQGWYERRSVVVGDVYKEHAQVLSGVRLGETVLIQVPDSLKGKEHILRNEING